MDIITYALCKKIAAHALSGVQSMSVNGQTLTINTKDSGVLTITFPTPKDGVSVTDIDINANNQIVFIMSNGSEIISGKIPTVKGDKGDPGVSPTITENADNTDKIYKLDITTADSTFTTPNLKGADGQGGTGGSGEENIIDSISVNGENIPPDKNKNVDIEVPNIYVGNTEPIDDSIEVWINPSGESSSIEVPIEKIKVNGELQTPVNKVVDITVPDAYDDTDIRAELANKADTDHTHTTVNGHTVESDVPVDAKFTDTVYDDTQIKTQIQAVANGLMDSVGYSADYKTIDIIAKNGVKKSVNVAPIISHASITELSDVDTTNKATGKALVYNATTSKHEYADISGTDEKVKMDASTDAKYLGELLDNVTIANENGELKVKKLDGQEVTITEINYLKGLTMNVMDLVNMFSNGGVKIINTPVATYAELLTIDKSSFIDGISYLVYVLADENHDNAKTTYLVDKVSETPTYFGFADSQRDFTTNPIDLATEITGKLGISNMDSDAIKALFTVDDTYKTETVTNNAFSTHGAKALYDELLLAIGNKANNSDLTAHKDDTDIHVSTEDRTKWDSAKTHADSAHAPSNAQENVLEIVKVNGTALTPSNKAVNVTVPTTVAQLTDSSSYAKKTDIPEALPANGGNADTVNNHTVKSDVPENAKFTDTVYDDTEVKGSINELNSNLDRLEFGEVAGGRNLLDFNSRIVDVLLNNTTGEVVKNSTSVGYWISQFIPVKAGEKYAVNNTSNSDMYWYDDNYSFIIKSQNVGFNKLTTAPSNAKFLRIDCSDKETIHSNAIIVENDSTIPYESYIPSVKMLAGVVNQQNERLADLGKRCINVLEHGIVGDGVTDNYDAIQNLINSVDAGSTIFFPKGVYCISKGLVTSSKNINIVGERKGRYIANNDTPSAKFGSIIKYIGTEDATMLTQGASDWYLTMSNITFYSDSCKFKDNGLADGTIPYLQYALELSDKVVNGIECTHGCQLRNVAVVGMSGYGIKPSQAQNIIECNIYSCRYGILQENNDLIIRNCYISASGTAIYCKGSKNLIASDCYMDLLTEYGIYCENYLSGNITDCYIDHSNYSAVCVKGASNNLNLDIYCGRNGIYYSGSAEEDIKNSTATTELSNMAMATAVCFNLMIESNIKIHAVKRPNDDAGTSSKKTPVFTLYIQQIKSGYIEGTQINEYIRQKANTVRPVIVNANGTIKSIYKSNEYTKVGVVKKTYTPQNTHMASQIGDMWIYGNKVYIATNITDAETTWTPITA